MEEKKFAQSLYIFHNICVCSCELMIALVNSCICLIIFMYHLFTLILTSVLVSNWLLPFFLVRFSGEAAVEDWTSFLEVFIHILIPSPPRSPNDSTSLILFSWKKDFYRMTVIEQTTLQTLSPKKKRCTQEFFFFNSPSKILRDLGRNRT